MTEYMKRAAGGFYIIDEPERDSKLWTVRRAVHQVIDPKTGHPYPERTVEQTYTRHLLEEHEQAYRWRKEYEGNFSNAAAGVGLDEESLNRACAQFFGSMVKHL